MDGPLVRGLSLQDVYRARARIQGLVHRTPLLPSRALGGAVGAPVHLKLENQQLTGSFKLRGALNAVLALTPEQLERGVVTVSTGNHGRAVAHTCRLLGVQATVCMSRLVPGNKLAAIEELGARTCIVGNSQDDAQVEADRLVAQEGASLVPPFDHPDIIAGQGTLGLEIAEQLLEMQVRSSSSNGASAAGSARERGEDTGRARRGDGSSRPRAVANKRGNKIRGNKIRGDKRGLQVIVPLSGGGLIAGVALALKALDRSIRVVGVSMEQGCAMYQSQEAGCPVQVEERQSLADSLGGGIGAQNRHTFRMVRDLVDELVLVDEEQIARGVVHAYREERQVVEGAGAVGIAAMLAGVVGSGYLPGGKGDATGDSRGGSTGSSDFETVVLLSGGNIDTDVHQRLVREGR
ncbi:MAG: threonine/serine dehydratase [Trueperaceae bacterium]